MKQDAAPKRRTRAHDREAQQKDRLNVLDFWQSWRTRFSAEVQAIGDSASQKMTLQDLLAIETAEMALLDEQLLKTGSIRSRAIIINAKVQARRNLRSLVLATGPAFNVNDLPIVLPIGMSEPDVEDRLDRAVRDRIAKAHARNPSASEDELRRAGNDFDDEIRES